MTHTVGESIDEYLKNKFQLPSDCSLCERRKRIRVKLLVSPFQRTRETASLILNTELSKWVTGNRIDISIKILFKIKQIIQS